VVRADKEKRGGKLLIERKLLLDWLHPDMGGTGDCLRIGEDNVLCVYDAKYGRGVPVEVEKNGRKNPQLSIYGIGAAEEFRRLVTKHMNVDRIEIIVIQPRAPDKDGPVRRLTIEHSELIDLSQDLVEAAEAADSPNPTFKAGDWCKFCKAKGACTTLRRFVMDKAQLDFDDEEGMTGHGELTTNPVGMTPEQVAHVMDAADVIEAWIRAVRWHAELSANAGTEIPGYKLVDKRATRKWVDDDKAAGELSLVFGLDETSIFKKKLLSPAQIEKLLPKAERGELASLYSKESSGKRLVKDGDPREERKPDVQADFDD